MANTWTQPQRDDAAAVISELRIGPYVAEHDAVWDNAIDLACQRNELLEALRCTMVATGWDDPCLDMNLPPWVNVARLAIAKAEAVNG